MNTNNEKAKMIQSIYALTPLQEGMLYHYLEKKSTDYIVQMVFSLVGDVDASKLKEALHLLYEKYEILRTFFIYEKMKAPRQVVMKTREAEFNQLCVSGSSNQEKQQDIEEIKRHDLVRGFDLQKDPLLRLTLISTESGEQKLIWTHHHIIMDGWCTSFLYGDFIRYYNLAVGGSAEEEIRSMISIEKSGISEYSEYVKWLENQDQQAATNYFHQLVDGYTEESGIASADFPEKSEHQMEKNCLLLEQEAAGKIIDLAKAAGTTLSTVFEAAWGILLQNYNHSNDVVYGKVVSGRSADIRGIERMVGLFINTVPVRITTKPEMTVTSLLKNTLKQAIETSSYEYCSLAEIQSQSIKGAELIKTLFAFGNFYIDEDNLKSAEDNLKITLEAAREETNYDLTLSVTGNEDGIRVELLFNPNQFSRAEIDLLLGRMQKILTEFIDHPEQRIIDIQIVPEQEMDILQRFNQTELAYDKSKTLVDIFAQIALVHSAQTAVFHGGVGITYGELDRLSNVVAGWLIDAGIKSGDFIPIIAERGIEMIAAILGVIKSGAAYVPILPDYPISRIKYIISDCNAKLALTFRYVADLEVPQINLDDLLIHNENVLSPTVIIAPTDPAYCIYTSGTSGKPKGVILSHLGAVALRSFFLQEYQVNQLDNVLQFANFVFDASVWELVMALFTGAKLTMIDKEVIADVQLFNQFVKEQGITMTLLPPQYYLETDIEGLRVLTTAGSAANHAVVKKAENCTRYVNAYGPTETTVIVSVWSPDGKSYKNIPIGKPITNTRFYVLNRNKLCGIGMVGELYIAGDGLAKGYLNNEELTAEKFAENPFETGKMYRTGDLARWLADGNIEYLGRIDEQVKIRGFRIEPGEIEQVIREQETITDAVVLAREDHHNEKVLCAYLVASQDIDLDSLKLKLSDELPEYMIPSYIEVIKHIPLNNSGKIDIGKLPPLINHQRGKYRVPETDLEQLLCRIYQEVLGSDQIGTEDKFYQLGGDSIKAIRVVTKVREAGYELSVRDVMKKQTVRLLALTLLRVQEEAAENQLEIIGTVVPTPIIKEFFSWDLERPHHFNQSFMIDITQFQTVDMEIVFHQLAVHHDMLRAVVEDHSIRIRPVAEGNLYELLYCDVSGEAKEADQITAQCNVIQQSMDLQHGPLFKGALFKTSQGSFLAVVIHHLLVDGVSWRILLEDIYTILKQLKQGSPVVLPDKTTSFQEWATVLDEYRTEKIPQFEKNYWIEALDSMQNIRFNMIKPKSDQPDRLSVVSMELNQQTTKQLLNDVSSAFQTTINDLLMTALSLACFQLTGQNKVVVGLEGHGREHVHRSLNIYRTVGWFTTIYPVLLCCGEDLKSSIINNKEILHRIPNHGFSYGLLKDQIAAPEIEIFFNYLGALDHQQELDVSEYSTGFNAATENGILGSLTANGGIQNGKLSFHFAYNESRIESAHVHKLVGDFKHSLEEIITFCANQDGITYTPSDFSAVDLSLSDFNEIIDAYQKRGQLVADIYSLTPLQQGMLFHHMLNRQTSEYIIQNTFTLDRELDNKLVSQVLELLVMKYEVLATAVYYETIEKARQIIVKDRKIPFICTVSAAEDLNLIAEKRAAATLAQGFDLQFDPLLRVELVKGNSKSKMIWTYHHIIVDGWCLQLLFTDFFGYYEKLASGYSYNRLKEDVVAEKAQLLSYSEYVQWLETRNEDAAIQYYQQLLEGYDHVAEFPSASESAAGLKRSYARTVNISQTISDSITAFARNHQVTINTVLETAYGIVLQNYSNSDDVVFGKIISGRNIDLPGIEKTVGLFINTIPIRIKTAADMTVTGLIKQSHKQGIESSNYGYCSLAEIQSKSMLMGDLVKTIYVFENYSSYDEHTGDGSVDLQLKAEGITEHTNYDISMCTSYPEEEIILKLIYNPDKYEIAEIDGILSMYKNILLEMVAQPEKKIMEIEMIEQKAGHSLIKEFNQTYRHYDSELTFAEAFETQVELYPDQIAVTYLEETLNYKELNERSNYVACILREAGIKPNDFAVIMADKSIEMIVGILGIIKSGAAYVPIDPELPENRIRYMLEDCNPKAVLKYCDYEIDGYQIIDLGNPIISRNQHNNLDIVSTADDLLYLIYTSGTTGHPKGVMVDNRGVLNLKNFFEDEYQITKSDCILQFANICFDASVWEVSTALLIGAALAVPSREQIQDPDQLAVLVKKRQVSVALLPPSYYLLVSDLDIRLLITGGSQANKEIIKKAKNRYVNAYGPTENTVVATCWEYRKGDVIPLNVPIGKPIHNVQVYILKEFRICPIGVIGELCIAGESLAKGYLNMPDLTAQKFIDNPFGEGKLYRTGDLARWKKGGDVEYVGRIDDQVKISGYRIELQEIESAVRQFPHIVDAAIIVSGEPSEEKTICAYFTTDMAIDPESLKAALQAQLPIYMIPTYYLQIAKIPLTASGKLDKKALPPIETGIRSEFTAPKDKLEQALCDLIGELTGIVNVGVQDNLFEIGVNSLKAIAIVGKIKKLGLNIKIQDIFDKKTIGKIAQSIRSQSLKNRLSKIGVVDSESEMVQKYYDELLRANSVEKMPAVIQKPLNNTLLTGVTGFLGIHLLAEFIEKESGKLYCLIRAKNEEDAYQRLLQTLEYYFGRKYHSYVKKRIFAVAGTIEKQDTLRHLPQDINTVIHSAAITKHFGFEEEFVRINISGTKHMLDYAISIGAKFVYISTTSVAERIRPSHNEPLTFDETCFIADQEEFSSEYTKTKYQAEKLVLTAKTEGQDTLVIRVGNLTNRSFDGKPIQNYQGNRFLNTIKYVVDKGFVNSAILDLDLQFSPVDLVAEAVISLVRQECDGHSVYHVFNDQTVKLERICNLLMGYGINFEHDESFDLTLDKNSEQAIILSEDSGMIYPNIRCDFTKWYLEKFGFQWHQPDDLYLQQVVRIFYENGFWKPVRG